MGSNTSWSMVETLRRLINAISRKEPSADHKDVAERLQDVLEDWIQADQERISDAVEVAVNAFCTTGTHEVQAGFDDIAFDGQPEEWCEKPFARIAWFSDRGDPDVGLQGTHGWTLAPDQTGTVVADLVQAPRLISIRDDLPDLDKANRVLVYTEGKSFNGQQFFDIEAAELYPEYLNGDFDAYIKSYITHWMYHPTVQS